VKPRVAVIDIGSNSIKALVAESDGSRFGLIPLYEETFEVRISQGIAGNPPMLKGDRIEAGTEAVSTLWKECCTYGPLSGLKIVATSAVRSASNGDVFMDAVETATHCKPSILSGIEEADAIAMGVRTDPAVGGGLEEFTVFDLGGGSLELIRFKEGRVVARTSLPLGSVRLTERFFGNPSLPIPSDEVIALSGHIHDLIEAADIQLGPPVVGCSGGLAALRHVMAERKKVPFETCHPVFKRPMINELAGKVLSQDLASRIDVSRIPAGRADIFPAALITFQMILELAGADELLHSLHNLRYGLAWLLLNPIPEDESPAHQE